MRSVVPGKRTEENVRQVVQEVKHRLGDEVPDLITTDEYPAYQTAILDAYGETVAPERNRNARKVRKSYCFSKGWQVHQAVTYFTMYSYNFCWPVRTLRVEGPDGHWQPRTPAMAAGLTDHVWSLQEWLAYPRVQRK